MSVSNEETPMQSEQPYEFSRDELRAIEHHRKLELGEQDEVFGTVFSQSAHFSYFPLAKVQGTEWVRRNAWGEIAIDAGRIAAAGGSKRTGVFAVPEVFVVDGAPLGSLRGTIIVLQDAGFSDDEVIDWLLADEESIGAAPIEALRRGRKAEVRRVAQTLA